MRYTNKKILKITFPVLVCLLMEQLIGLTDTAYLGRVGEAELGASALAGIFYLLVNLPLIVLAFLLCLLMRSALGSAAVAMVTTSSIVAPLCVHHGLLVYPDKNGVPAYNYPFRYGHSYDLFLL